MGNIADTNTFQSENVTASFICTEGLSARRAVATPLQDFYDSRVKIPVREGKRVAGSCQLLFKILFGDGELSFRLMSPHSCEHWVGHSVRAECYPVTGHFPNLIPIHHSETPFVAVGTLKT